MTRLLHAGCIVRRSGPVEVARRSLTWFYGAQMEELATLSAVRVQPAGYPRLSTLESRGSFTGRHSKREPWMNQSCIDNDTRRRISCGASSHLVSQTVLRLTTDLTDFTFRHADSGKHDGRGPAPSVFVVHPRKQSHPWFSRCRGWGSSGRVVSIGSMQLRI